MALCIRLQTFSVFCVPSSLHNLGTLDFDMTSPTIPAATHDHLTVRGTKGKYAGRSLHVTGARAYRPGDLIATFTDPLLVLPKGPAAKTICNNCLAAQRGDQATTSCKACTGCKAVAYCGPACQKADWARVHKLECKAFRKVRASVGKDWLPTPVRALLQILRRWEAEEAVRDAFGRLEGNVDGFRKKEDVWKEIGLQAYGGMAYAGRKETDDQLHMARDILCKVSAPSTGGCYRGFPTNSGRRFKQTRSTGRMWTRGRLASFSTRSWPW